MKKIRKIKTCVNCRHLDIIEEGKVVKNLDETSYIAFKCEIFNYSGREVFKFPTGEKTVKIERETDECPFWEEWKKENDKLEEEKGSDAETVVEPDNY